MARTNSKTRRHRRHSKTAPSNADSLRGLFQWLLPDDAIFSGISFHGNIKWMPIPLVCLALCWAWSEARYLTDAFSAALQCCQKLFVCTPLGTYQGFMGALVGWTARLLPRLQRAVQQRMQQLGCKFWRCDGWVPIAFDGSRSTAPRTRSNEAALAAKNYGKGRTARYRKKKSKGMRRRRNEKNKPQPPQPQAWVTLLWHMGLRLPWTWRHGPSDSSERAHVMDMMQTEAFPRKTLFCGDAGFVGYPLWSSLLEKGHEFLVRVGSNVRLLTEQADCRFEKHGRERVVLCWPRRVRRAEQPPLRLRLLRVRLGKLLVWMLTSVLEREELTARAAVRFYKMRWGIEVGFRGLKQTLDRGTLRCRNDQRLFAELDWSLVAMAVVELWALREQQKPPVSPANDAASPPDPAKRSLAKALRVLRRCLRNLDERCEAGKDLASGLRAAVTDSYRRKASKRARYRPPNPDIKPLGDPKLRVLDPEERRELRESTGRKAA
jgi:hypothetical protein